MKFAICNEMFEGWPLEEVFAFAKQVGYDAVEIAPFTLANSVTDISPQRRAEIRRRAEEMGIEIAGLHWLLVKPEGLHINHPNPLLRRCTQDYLVELIRFCHDIGGKVLVFGSPAQRGPVEGQTYQEAWELALETFRRCAEAAEEYGVWFCLEPLPPPETNFLMRKDEVVAMVEAIGSPRLQLMLDVKAMCGGEWKPIPQVIREAAPYLRHFHANDANRRGPGWGRTDFRPIAEALHAIGYDGYVSVEVFDFRPTPVEIARRSFEYLQTCFRLSGSSGGSPSPCSEG